MKRFLISACVAMALPSLALSQTIGAAPAKPAAKKPAAAAPAAKKPKVAVMSKDELRACLKTQQGNSIENKAIDVEKEAFQKERDAIMADKDGMQKQIKELEASAKTIMADSAVLQEEAKEFNNPVPKEKLKEAEAKRVAFNDKVGAHQVRIDAYNADKNVFNANKDKLDARIAANNARGRTLQDRTEKYNDAVDQWRADCGNKQYEVDDEKAIKKELGIN